jgi:hypothetical protein
VEQRTHRRFQTVVLMVAASALVGTLGCGYQFSGESALLFKNIHSIYVEPFINRTREVGIDREITSALRSEFYRRGRLQLTDRADQADAILSGVIRTLDSHVASVNRKDEVLQYESVMTLDVTLRRREPDEVLYRGQGTRLTQLYSGSRAAVVTTSSRFQTGTLNARDVRNLTDIQLTEAQRADARDQLMAGFARELHQKLVEMF